MNEMTTDLLARLEALTTRLDDLEVENDGLKAQVARLAMPWAEAGATDLGTTHKVQRRGMLRTVLGATAAAAVLTVAKGATTAEAAGRGNVSTGTSNFYGFAATAGLAGD